MYVQKKVDRITAYNTRYGINPLKLNNITASDDDMIHNKEGLHALKLLNDGPKRFIFSTFFDDNPFRRNRNMKK